MIDKKSNKGKIWIYAVVLFTSAFIVLLLTAYSQIKFNRNILNYQNRISVQETEKKRIMLNYETASKEIDRLLSEVESLNKKNMDSDVQIEQLKQENENLKAQNDKSKVQYEMLITAQDEYMKGNIVICADILSRITNPNDFSSTGLAKYTSLKEKTFKEAALILYKEGYNYYRKKEYSEAEKSFLRSLEFADDEYFSDDCYYLMALSEYKSGDHETAKNHLEALILNYNESNYADDAKILLEQLQ